MFYGTFQAVNFMRGTIDDTKFMPYTTDGNLPGLFPNQPLYPSTNTDAINQTVWTMEKAFGQGGKEIFMDMAWQHEAYRLGGTRYLQIVAEADKNKLRENQRIDEDTLKAWEKIASGDPQQVLDGNQALLHREQWQTIQPRYEDIQDAPLGGWARNILSKVAVSAVPGGKPFVEVMPTGDLTVDKDRWEWIKKDMWQAFVNLHNSGQAITEAQNDFTKDGIEASVEHFKRFWQELTDGK